MEFELKRSVGRSEPEPLKCDVCGQPAIGVASSSLGAISFAYCQRCVDVSAEPYGILVGTLTMIGGRDHAAPWVAEVIDGTLSVPGKTIEQLDADVAVEETRFMRDMNEMYEKEGDK